MNEREIESPILRLPTSDGEIILHYLNSRLRTFLDTDLDHVEYRDDEGTLKGLRVGRAVLDAMFENQYPMSFDPIPDESTIEWFISSEARLLDDELDNL